MDHLREFITKSPEETEKLGYDIAIEIKSKDKKSYFVALYGDLGAGKTAFTRGFVGALVPGAAVKSPTYSIVNVYKNDSFRVNHFDCYRITDDDDLYSTGFYDYLDDSVTVCEWSENIPFALPIDYCKVTIKKISEDCRSVSVEYIGG